MTVDEARSQLAETMAKLEETIEAIGRIADRTEQVVADNEWQRRTR